MTENPGNASGGNPPKNRCPPDTKPNRETAGLMTPMTGQSDSKAHALRDSIRKAKDTLKAAGTTYYVSNTGNDNNSGTSPSQAWASINKVNSWDYEEGDVVLFNRGISSGEPSQPGTTCPTALTAPATNRPYPARGRTPPGWSGRRRPGTSG